MLDRNERLKKLDATATKAIMNWDTQYLDPNLSNYAREKMVEEYRNEKKSEEKNDAQDILQEIKKEIKMQEVYMIERNSIPFGTDWFCAGEKRWTQDPNKAIHFPCKESARETFRAILKDDSICFPFDELSADGSWKYSYDVTSHGWIEP